VNVYPCLTERVYVHFEQYVHVREHNNIDHTPTWDRTKSKGGVLNSCYVNAV
jgi:hypothetical protein